MSTKEMNRWKKRIEKFILKTKDALGMKDKEFFVLFQRNLMNGDTKVAAKAFENFGACQATIWFCEDILERIIETDDFDDLKRILIHEVCHIILFQYENAAHSIIDHLSDTDNFELYERQLVQHCEITVDRLAIALTKLIPFEV